jgi:hypothetical protein
VYYDARSDLYNNSERHAQALERLYRIPADRQIAMLKKYAEAGGCDLDTAFWSLDGLRYLLPALEFNTVLRQLVAKSPLDINIELYLDWALSEQTSDWPTSDQRFRLLENWMRRSFTPPPVDDLSDGERMILAHFQNLVSHPELLPPTFYPRLLQIIIAGLTANQRTDLFKKELLEQVKNNYYEPRTRSAARTGFEYLHRVIRTSPHSEQRQAVAQLLSSFVPLNKQQTRSVHDLLNHPACKDALPHLKAVLKRTEELWLDFSTDDEETVKKVKEIYRKTPVQTIAFFQERIPPTTSADPARIQRLIADLEHDDFQRRQLADRQLWDIGLFAEPALRKALDHTESAEARRRLTPLLHKLHVDRSTTLRAIHVLKQIQTLEARSLLQDLAHGAPDAEVTREATKALKSFRKQ